MISLTPSVWTMGGFDPCAGAGLLADARTLHTLGVLHFGVTTALTAQNGATVTRVDAVSIDLIEAQIHALKKLGWPAVIKLSLLPNEQVIQCLDHLLTDYPGQIIYDPVMVASAGMRLMSPQALPALLQLLKRVTILTPNLPEAECITHQAILTEADQLACLKKLLDYGVSHVILKGGHKSGSLAQDLYWGPKEHFWLNLPKLSSPPLHGTGCVFSAALAGFIAKNYAITEAFVLAKMAIHQSIRLAYQPFSGMAYACLSHWPADPQDLPWLTQDPDSAFHRLAFAPCQKKIGFYPVVQDLRWVQQLNSWGAKSIQLRIKSKDHRILADEISQAVQSAPAGQQLFINDHWALAMQHQAYGVHLGQEDLFDCDLPKLAQAGLRLGVSTHNYCELARAHALQPSYIALGPIYPTTSKIMAFEAQGLARLRHWRQLVSTSLVAIGGITTDNLSDIAAIPVDGIAVISALTQAPDPFKNYQFFSNLCDTHV